MTQSGTAMKIIDKGSGGASTAARTTAMALIATGLAVTSVLPEFSFAGGRRLIGVPLIALGALMAIASFWRWEANERAMRLGNPLPSSRLPQLLAIGVGVAALIAAVVAAFGAK